MLQRKKPAARKPKRGKHGGARKGAGPKPNPLRDLITVETKETAAEMARPYLAEAIGALVGTIRNPRANDSARNAAAKHIIDAAKPAEGAEATAPDPSEISDLDLARWILSILENAAEAQEAAQGDAAWNTARPTRTCTTTT